MILSDLLQHFYELFLLLGFVAGVVKYKILSKSLRLILLFVVFGILTEVTMDVLKEFGMRNTMPVGNIYFPISILILGFFYFFLLKNYVNKNVIIGVIATFELLCILNYIYIQNLQEFPNITAAVGALIIIAFSIIMFARLISEAKVKKLWKEPVVWISTAFLIYFSANFFFYILFNLNVEFSMDFTRQVYLFYIGFNILLYALIFIGFLKVSKNNKI